MTSAPNAPADLARARSLIASAKTVLFVTGAGVSAESGVPTFRGQGGLWKQYRAEELATPEAFQRDPRLVWEWYAWRREIVAACEPNAAHRSVARFIHRCGGARLVTQNVDGLHERAARGAAREDGGESGTEEAGGSGRASPGTVPGPREWPLALHGSLFVDRCSRCDYSARADGAVDASSPHTLPRCPECGALLRPGVVWFGEALDPRTIDEAFRLAERADVLVSIGTSSIVHPAASLPLATRAAGGALIEVNPEPTPLSSICEVALRGPAATLVPALLEES